jgi:hypothetical protein
MSAEHRARKAQQVGIILQAESQKIVTKQYHNTQPNQDTDTETGCQNDAS